MQNGFVLGGGGESEAVIDLLGRLEGVESMLHEVAVSERQMFERVFRRVRKITISDSCLRHVCLSAWNNSAPTGWVLMELDI
jgi:hypothetical protein